MVSLAAFLMVGGELILRHDHKFLESETATSMRTSVEDIHEWDRKHVWLLCAGEVGDMCIERDTLLGSTSPCN